MLSYIPEINTTMRGVGELIGTQRPFIGFLIRNWPLAALGGVALVVRLRERHKKGELSLYNGMADFGLIISPLVGLALLNQLARDEAIIAAQQAPVQPSGMTGLGQPTYDFHPGMLANQPMDQGYGQQPPTGQAVPGSPMDGVQIVNQTPGQGQGRMPNASDLASHLSGGMWSS